MSKLQRRQFLIRTGALSLLSLTRARAEQTHPYRVGIVFQGGIYSAVLDGLRDGLKELGLEEGKQIVFHVRDVKSDLKSVAAAARSLEQEKVNLIFSVGSSVAVQTKDATKNVPIVFYAGTDPTTTGLVASFAKPGGRLTGLYSRFNDLLPKRFELLKLLVPNTQRVLVFYNPATSIAVRSVNETHEVARRFKVNIIERRVADVEELRAGLLALRTGEADACFQPTDGFMVSQAQLVADMLKEKKVPYIVPSRDAVEKGALAGYGISYYSVGRGLAKYVRRVLSGTSPADVPVELIDVFHFVINLRTAKSIGLRIPDSLLARADEVIR